MFERFTNQSRRAVVLAQEEARDLRHDYIGTEHLLLGLLHEGTGSAARALTSMDVTLDAARQEVEASVGRGGSKQASGHIPFTPRSKTVLELSLRESLQLGHGYISTGHLLLGLIRQGDDVAVQVLGRIGTDLAVLRARVIKEMADRPEQEEEAGVIRVVRDQPRLQLRMPTEIRNLLEAIEARLSAIEQRLGISRSIPDALRGLDERIAAVRRDKDAALDARDFGEAASLRTTERDLLAQRARVMREMTAGEGTGAEAEPGGTAQAGGGAEAGGGAKAGGGAEAGGGADEPGDPPAAAGR
jgi:Clp amino terminal domain, pathogenicity island component